MAGPLAAKRRESEDPPEMQGLPEREGDEEQERKRERERDRERQRERGKKKKKKGRAVIKREGDTGDPRIHRGAQTAWSLFYGALIYNRQTNRLASSAR